MVCVVQDTLRDLEPIDVKRYLAITTEESKEAITRLRQLNKAGAKVPLSTSVPGSFKDRRNTSEETVETQMMGVFKSDLRCVDRSATKWAKHLECDPSTIKKTDTWKACMKERGLRQKTLQEHLKNS